MCGFITTISKKDVPFSRDKLAEMMGMIAHRGPNDEGVFYHENWLSQGFRRLSILDLSEQGHQPMQSADGNYSIVFNGEIYNFREIRLELEQKGYVFHSNSDTEVLLSSYLEWGKACVDKLLGMYAFVLADLKNQTVFAARDPLGIKPLFFYEDDDYYFLCSEVKALLPYCNLEPNPETVNEYLVFRSVIGRETMFKNVYSLLHGHCLEYSNGSVKESCFFDLAQTFSSNYQRSFEEVCEETEALLQESVKLHLRSDVELGVQLSGGVDSSLITAMASQQTGQRFHSFSISLGDCELDESEYQQRVSYRYGTVHHDYPFTEDLFADLFNRTIWSYEHPLNDPNTVATLYLTERAKKHITVMLSGEGADESFLGYSRFNFDAMDRLKKRTWLYRHQRLRRALAAIWPISKGKQLLNITKYCPAMYVPSYADLNWTDRLLKGNDLSMTFRHDVIKAAGGDTLIEAELQDQVCDLMQWFWRADRTGMAASLELRVPFCTVPMFEMANSIPYEQRVYKGERKAVLKKIAEKYIDHDQIYRKKIGFGVAIDEWLGGKGAYSQMYHDYMDGTELSIGSIADTSFFSDLLKQRIDGKYREPNCAFLWTYLNLEAWYRIFFDGGWRSFVTSS